MAAAVAADELLVMAMVRAASRVALVTTSFWLKPMPKAMMPKASINRIGRTRASSTATTPCSSILCSSRMRRFGFMRLSDVVAPGNPLLRALQELRWWVPMTRSSPPLRGRLPNFVGAGFILAGDIQGDFLSHVV